jgi:hypothetical protein
MSPELLARRAEALALIDEDPIVVSVSRPATKDNGAGLQIPDPDGIPTISRARIRIAHESASVPGTVETPVGLGTNLARYVITDYSAPLKESDTITEGGGSWIVGEVTPFLYLGRVYKTVAPLRACPELALAIPIGLAAEALSSSAIDLTWAEVNLCNGYSLERKTGAGAFSVIGTIAAGTFIFHDTGLAPKTAYVYRMRESLGGVYSDYSATAEATTEAA